MSISQIEQLIHPSQTPCPCCGKIHRAHLKKAVIEKGAIRVLSHTVGQFGGTKVFLMCDENTFHAGGEKTVAALQAGQLPFVLYRAGKERVEPDENFIGNALLHFDFSCDCIVVLGTGVLNDTGKILSAMRKCPLITVATAPSMDGYASSTSSVIRNGLKVSINSRCPDAVIGDLDILCRAPLPLCYAGLGDILAKYVSICEWRIGQAVNAEYYCESIAQQIRTALKTCVENAEGLSRREEGAVESVMRGLLLSGIAADFAGISRPVSGTEHYISHIWDMRALSHHTPFALHGIQCGIAVKYVIKVYEELKALSPEKVAERYIPAPLDSPTWDEEIKTYLSSAADSLLEISRTQGFRDIEGMKERVAYMREHWSEILDIIDRELPTYDEICRLDNALGNPFTPAQYQLDEKELPYMLKLCRDVRNKYILSTMLWDFRSVEANKDVSC